MNKVKLMYSAVSLLVDLFGLQQMTDDGEKAWPKQSAQLTDGIRLPDTSLDSAVEQSQDIQDGGCAPRVSSSLTSTWSFLGSAKKLVVEVCSFQASSSTANGLDFSDSLVIPSNLSYDVLKQTF